MPTGSLHSPKIRTGLLDTDLALKHRIETLTALVSALVKEIDRLRAELPPTKKYLAKHNARAGFKQALINDMGIDFYREIELYEIELIKRALHRGRGSQRRAAELLGLNPTTLNAKLKHFANCGFDLTVFFRNKGDHLGG
jgi:DNA-binding NtrC family response regulator